MDSDSLDLANPFFKYDLSKICGVCAKKLPVANIYSLTKKISGCENVMVYQVLESVSNFKFQEDGTKFICQTCYINTCVTYKFQESCNKTQLFLDKFIEHQSKLSEELLPIEHIKVEEIEHNVDDGGEAIGESEPAKKRPCKFCNKLISTHNMAVHQRIHAGEKPYKCQHCDASFSTWGSLQFHKACHENKRNYVCEICALTFNDPATLKTHEQMHTGYRRFKCMECEMTFSSKWYLRRHSVTHTNEKPYTCEFCQKSFRQKGNLTVHQKKHIGEQPSVCAICGESFIHLQSFKIHMQTHSTAAAKCKNKEVEEVSGENSSNDTVAMDY